MVPRGAFSTALALLLALAATGARTAAVRAEEESRDTARNLPSVEQVFAAWRQREARAERFYAEWIHERTYTKFWANCHVPFARDEYVTLHFAPSALTLDGDRLRFDAGAVDDSGGGVPLDGVPQPVRFGKGMHNDALRVFRDDRIRYDGGRPRVDPREPAPTDWPRNLRPFCAVFDGRTNVQYLPAERGSAAEAYRFAGTENQYRDSLHFRPLVLAVRPSWLGLSSGACRIEPPDEPQAGRNYCVLVDTGGLRREFWLDMDREFVVTSYREDCDVLGARMQNRIDISYSRDEGGLWLPSAWTTVFFDNHGLMEQYAPATVLSASTDAAFAARRFHVELEPGTWVFDEETGRHHIVGAAGNAEPIAMEELEQGLSHAELIARASWPGRVSVAARQAWRHAPLRFVVFVMLFGVIAAALPRRKSATVP